VILKDTVLSDMDNINMGDIDDKNMSDMNEKKDKRNFVSLKNINSKEIEDIFILAETMKSSKNRYSDSLDRKVLAMIFEKPSLRTRVTFETGIYELGGHGIYLSPNDVQIGKRESIFDVAKNLSRWAHGVVIRTFAHSTMKSFAEASDIPIINGLDDLVHPCQALTDLFTLRELKGSVRGLTLAWVGDGNNVAHSLMRACAKIGVNMNLAVPEGFEPDAEITEEAMDEASKNGTVIRVLNDPAEAVRGADAVYTDTWASMGQESEAAERKKIFKPYQVNTQLMREAKKDAFFMHCLPAHRGEEVTDVILDSSRSVVFEQAENRLHVAKAIMYMLMR
jgi:ornithine carbamoyltransferase